MPTSIPSQESAKRAVALGRGSNTKIRAPADGLEHVWKKIGGVSRALEPHRTTTSVSSTSW